MKHLALLALLAGLSAHAQNKALTRVPIGMEGRILYRCSGSPLRARPVNDKARVTARIVSQVADGDATLYDIRFISQYAGRPDVRDALERVDGTPLTDAPVAIVDVSMALPLDHDGSLAISDGPGLPRLGGYRAVMVGAGLLWCAPLVLALIARMRRAAPAPHLVAEVPPPTLADQLRPLVNAVLAGSATLADKARLERMLIAFWRERLHLEGIPAVTALQRVREDRAAGALLVAVESWLHKPTRASVLPTDVSALLAPYAQVTAGEQIHQGGDA